MRYVKDTTGRFSMRPHYEPAELDKEVSGSCPSYGKLSALRWVLGDEWDTLDT